MSFAALKNIPCPKGNSCTAFQCLFGHEKDKGPAVTPSAATGSSASSTRTSAHAHRRSPDPDSDSPSHAHAQGPPRKRQRTETGQEHVAAAAVGTLAPPLAPAAGAPAEGKTPSKPINPSGATVQTPDGSLAAQAAGAVSVLPSSSSSSSSSPALLKRLLAPPPEGRPSDSHPPKPPVKHKLKALLPIHKDPATPSDSKSHSQSESRRPFTPHYTDSEPSPIQRGRASVASSSAVASPTIKIPSSARPAASTVPPSSSPNPSPSTNPSSSTATTAAANHKPRKAESLNPRFVHKAPSSYETRFKLVKLLHAEYVRLNSALKKELKAAPTATNTSRASDGEPDPAAQDTRGLVLSDQQLIWKALDDEERAAVDKPSIYNNVLRNLIMQYKRMAVKQWREERIVARDQKAARGGARHHQQQQNNTNNTHHHQQTQSQSQSQAAARQQTPKKIVTGLTPDQEVQMLRHLVTPIDKLADHGYVSVAPTEAEVQKAREGLAAAQGWEKCDRCTKRFQVIPDRRDEDGSLTTGGKCTYHWGKTYVPERPPGDRSRVPKRYRCCGQEVGDSPGCTDAPHHVFKATDPKRLATVLNFAETPANPAATANGAVCFDCEMCYTVNGLELVRLTATSWPSGRELLDILVLPVGQILDLNSRFSGVWPDDLARAVPWSPDDTARLRAAATASSSPEKGAAAAAARGTPDHPMKVVGSPEIARGLLFSLITPETPLIGHGLENDLNSVRIIHPTIIDTVLLHPHKHGLPFRYGLKMLMDTLLNRKIQVETDGKVQGHDSAEDARAAGELVLLKVMEKWQEMRFNRWTIDKDTGAFVEPPDLTAPGLTVEFLEAAH